MIQYMLVLQWSQKCQESRTEKAQKWNDGGKGEWKHMQNKDKVEHNNNVERQRKGQTSK